MILGGLEKLRRCSPIDFGKWLGKPVIAIQLGRKWFVLNQNYKLWDCKLDCSRDECTEVDRPTKKKWQWPLSLKLLFFSLAKNMPTKYTNPHVDTCPKQQPLDMVWIFFPSQAPFTESWGDIFWQISIETPGWLWRKKKAKIWHENQNGQFFHGLFLGESKLPKNRSILCKIGVEAWKLRFKQFEG